jgi:hypothetical protein
MKNYARNIDIVTNKVEVWSKVTKNDNVLNAVTSLHSFIKLDMQLLLVAEYKGVVLLHHSTHPYQKQMEITPLLLEKCSTY